MATVTLTLEEYNALLMAANANQIPQTEIASEPASKKRKRSAYSRELSKQLKMLRKQHPRTPVTKLMKKAHRLTKKAMKK